jgi:hypothetical protein
VLALGKLKIVTLLKVGVVLAKGIELFVFVYELISHFYIKFFLVLA